MFTNLFRRSLKILCAGLPMALSAAPDPSTTPEGRHSLAVAELRRVAGPTIEKMNSSSDTRWFIEDLQKSPDRMADLMFSGPLEDPAKSLRILAALWKSDPNGLKDRHEATTAAAVALIFAKAKWPEDKALDRYKFYRDSRLAGQLHVQFDTLQTWEKCFVVSGGPNGGWGEAGGGWGDDSLVWLRDNVKLTAKEYTGACWQAPYKLNNLFGDSIHGKNYYAPFSDEIHAERVRDVGGVCGSLSHYGATAARANGLPAITMGEPGHCAYAVRTTRGTWEPAYSLTWERSLHTSLWGNTWTQLVLQEKVLGDREVYQQAMARVWQARAVAKRDPELAESFYGDGTPGKSHGVHDTAKSSNRQLPAGEWATLTVVGEPGRNTIWLNGEKIGESNNQLVCPLRQLGGGAGESFVGTIRKLKVVKRECPSRSSQVPRP